MPFKILYMLLSPIFIKLALYAVTLSLLGFIIYYVYGQNKINKQNIHYFALIYLAASFIFNFLSAPLVFLPQSLISFIFPISSIFRFICILLALSFFYLPKYSFRIEQSYHMIWGYGLYMIYISFFNIILSLFFYFFQYEELTYFLPSIYFKFSNIFKYISQMKFDILTITLIIFAFYLIFHKKIKKEIAILITAIFYGGIYLFMMRYF